MVDWLRDHLPSLLWLTGISVAVVTAALLGAHAFLLKLPADSLTHRKRPPVPLTIGPIPASAAMMAKNLLGSVCIVAGLAMLVLPGPGHTRPRDRGKLRRRSGSASRRLGHERSSGRPGR